MIQVFLDCETGGVDAKTDALLQVAGEVVVNGVVAEEFNYHMRPMPGKKVSASAQKVNGLTEEKIQTFADPTVAFLAFRTLLRKYGNPYVKSVPRLTLVGYNVGFDEQFIRQWFADNGERYLAAYFYWPSIDVAVLAAHVLGEDRKLLASFKLGDVACHFKCPGWGENLHDAMADIRLTRELYTACETATKKKYNPVVETQPDMDSQYRRSGRGFNGANLDD